MIRIFAWIKSKWPLAWASTARESERCYTAACQAMVDCNREKADLINSNRDLVAEAQQYREELVRCQTRANQMTAFANKCAERLRDLGERV